MARLGHDLGTIAWRRPNVHCSRGAREVARYVAKKHKDMSYDKIRPSFRYDIKCMRI